MRTLRQKSQGPGAAEHDGQAVDPARSLPEGSLASLAVRDAGNWVACARRRPARILRRRSLEASESIAAACGFLRELAAEGAPLSAEEHLILESARLLRAVSREAAQALRSVRGFPTVRLSRDESEAVPRAYAVAAGFLSAVDFTFRSEALAEYLRGLGQAPALRMAELWSLKGMLQLVLLEQLGIFATALREGSVVREEREKAASGPLAMQPECAIRSLHAIEQTNWTDFFETNNLADSLLRADPSGFYLQMDFESRQLYRDAVARLAAHSPRSEEEVAAQALDLARKSKPRRRKLPSRATERRTHVGYFLIESGSRLLKKKIGYRPPLLKRIQEAILEWPEVYYVVGVELITLVFVYFLLRRLGAFIPFLPGLLLLIPTSQAAVGLMNHLTSAILPPRRLPKLDLAGGIPPDCTTLVVVPCLLLNETQVRRSVESLEVRYLGNRDPNLHFALLTDSPDAPEPFDHHDELVRLCSSLVQQLNEKYSLDQKGGFFHLHRHQLYNPAEEAWMGWERKRGKLLDLNRLLRNRSDAFPVKIGDLSILPSVHYVLTLDADTQLPRGSAQRLVGALAHPLNRAVLDPQTNTVVRGYTILQPRVDISIESARHSRLASIYSGQTGFDVYTRAVSDVYQDLFGEGNFTGKGIYEVDAFQRVLGDRFPCNALLSHDLLEGLYARAGLISDVQVIDDYPSHFSAYCRRLHRWVRGDWQILRWLFPRVPDFSGRLIPNPLTLLSRWKIFDNLRRSLIEVNLLLVLLAGWFFLPGGPVYWTVITVALLLAPTYFQLLFSVPGFWKAPNRRGALADRANCFLAGHLQVFIKLVFLPHQAFVMLDAILRTLTRLTVTHRKLLEWETAAEAESRAKRRTPVEAYLALTPWFSLAVATGLAWERPAALLVASPVLGLWLLAGLFTRWVNQPPGPEVAELSRREARFLRISALYTWRYFRQFSNAETHWLIPDRVQEAPHIVVSHLSPTNLGLLLNARLASHRLGYLTLQEFADETEQTLLSAKRFPRFKGHFFNWYDIETFTPLAPEFVSSVDSGNLVACLWTLKQACLALMEEPLLMETCWQGVRDHFALLIELSKTKPIPRKVAAAVRNLARTADRSGEDPSSWMKALSRLEEEVLHIEAAVGQTEPRTGERQAETAADLAWWLSETRTRLASLRKTVECLAPWCLPEFESLRLERADAPPTLTSLPAQVKEIERQLDGLSNREDGGGATALTQAFRLQLAACARQASSFSQRLCRLAKEADQLLREMDFRFLYDTKRKALSVGYHCATGQLETACYDLLASEARAAVFVAIAKNDIPQEAWFRLGRARILQNERAALLSWSGTLFEYLMPLLWMRSHQGTILQESARAVLRCQQQYSKRAGVPWGISEAAFCARDRQGIYQYRAFGLPALAFDPNAPNDCVIAPYASFLALPVDAAAATHNLNTMQAMGWRGRFGFYESADYTTDRLPGKAKCEVVRCWLAHHQGMSLLALTNLLCRSSIQIWFHREPSVIATELLLHEKAPQAVPVEASSVPSAQQALRDRTSRTSPRRSKRLQRSHSPAKESYPPSQAGELSSAPSFSQASSSPAAPPHPEPSEADSSGS